MHHRDKGQNSNPDSATFSCLTLANELSWANFLGCKIKIMIDLSREAFVKIKPESLWQLCGKIPGTY